MENTIKIGTVIGDFEIIEVTDYIYNNKKKGESKRPVYKLKCLICG